MIHARTFGTKNHHLLLLHGWGQQGAALIPLAQLLAQQATVHVVDLPGFGDSPRPSSCWSTFDYADALNQWLSEKKISQVDCIGHSFGGKISLCMATRYPDTVGRIALLGSSGIRSALPLHKRIQYSALSYAGRSIKLWDRMTGMDLFQRHYAPRIGSADYLAAGEMRDILVRTIQDDLTPHLSAITCPTLLLWGEGDTASPPSVGRAIAEKIPQSELLLFPGKNHFLLHDVSSHLMARYLIPFLFHG